MFACGSNGYGQLGLGDTTNRNTLTAVPALPDGKVVKQVVAGCHHMTILTEDGTVFACHNTFDVVARRNFANKRGQIQFAEFLLQEFGFVHRLAKP